LNLAELSAFSNSYASNSFCADESAQETGKNESLADDNTTLMLQASDNFQQKRQKLNDFTAVSGLHCNFDKTCVLLVGPRVENLDLAGFSEVDKIKLLGIT
jgi:hypothetical protein